MYMLSREFPLVGSSALQLMHPLHAIASSFTVPGLLPKHLSFHDARYGCYHGSPVLSGVGHTLRSKEHYRTRQKQDQGILLNQIR